MSEPKVKGKRVTHYPNKSLDFNSYKDANDNLIEAGDYVLYVSEAKYPTVLITQVLLECLDNTSDYFLCIKLKNGQYKPLEYCKFYLVTPDFMRINSHLCL